MPFYDVVLDWLRHAGKQPGAVKVVRVEGTGSDWAGDTEGGFYDRFEVVITWEDAGGHTHREAVGGEQTASLWDWVVGSWPGGR